MAQQSTPVTSAPFLYVIVGDDGKIEKQGDGYVLRIRRKEIDHVLEFSEEPFKLANYISKDAIRAGWKVGAGNFGPGITMAGTILSDEGAIPDISISAIAKTDREMQFTFTLADGQTLDLRKFDDVDDVTVINYCCHPDGGGGEWLWGN